MPSDPPVGGVVLTKITLEYEYTCIWPPAPTPVATPARERYFCLILCSQTNSPLLQSNLDSTPPTNRTQPADANAWDVG
jgi:hypothetical protein